MYRVARNTLVALVVALPLAGCAGFGNYDFDPTDLMPEWFNSKKKLTGERKPVFPEGVPGVAHGVPSDLIKGNQQADIGLVPGRPQAAAQPEERRSRPKAQPRPKSTPPTDTASNQSTQTPVESRWPDSPPPQQQPQRQQQPRQQQQQQSGGQWPEPPAQRQQQPAAQWPDPPAQRPQGGGPVQWPDPPTPR
jgi:hypothetical protein